MNQVKFAKVIYRIDYPPCFKLITQAGDILDQLSKNKFWNTVGEEAQSRKIVVQSKLENQTSSLLIDPTSVSGVHECEKVESQTLSKIWSSINEVINKLSVEKFARLGIRFYLLYPVNGFEDALSPISELINSEAIKVINKNKLNDVGLSLVFDEEGVFTRFTLGPMKKEEFKNHFQLYKQISVENGVFYDIDYYTMKYEFKSFKFDVFAETAYKHIKDKVDRFNEYLFPQEKLI